MKSLAKDLFEPVIPMSYLQLMVEIMAERGMSVEALLQGSGMSMEQAAQSDARMSAAQWGLVVANALRASGDWGLGYEYGLRMRLSVHGFLGYAAMSSLTLGDALDILVRYFQSRQRSLSLFRTADGEACVIEMTQLHPLSMGHPMAPVRAFMFEALMVGIVKGVSSMLQLDGFPGGAEICFDWPEPDYYRHYRDRLPAVRFDQPGNCLRISTSVLALRPHMADALASQQAVERCEQELALAGGSHESVSQQVRTVLASTMGSCPTQDQLAARLHMSSRSLARKLQMEGCSFSQLLKEERRRVASYLLEYSSLELQQIASQLGYVDPANFTRAFRQWTGELPSQYRYRLRKR
ncbi:MAG: AraC family transcriptional regulator [Pseudomonadota bacterium]